MAAYSAANLGRFHEALQLERRAFDLDPLDTTGCDALAETKFYMGQLDEAAADGRKALEMNPDVWPGAILLSKIYLMQGRSQDTLAEIELVRFDATCVAIFNCVSRAR
jgi:tetratricopeptide (TPR) repeat protein